MCVCVCERLCMIIIWVVPSDPFFLDVLHNRWTIVNLCMYTHMCIYINYQLKFRPLYKCYELIIHRVRLCAVSLVDLKLNLSLSFARFCPIRNDFNDKNALYNCYLSQKVVQNRTLFCSLMWHYFYHDFTASKNVRL